MPHLYGGNFVLGTNDIHETQNLIDRFHRDFREKAEGRGFELVELVWLPNTHAVFILFDFHPPDGFDGDPDEVLAGLLLTELPKGVASFTTTQAYTSRELRNVLRWLETHPPQKRASGSQEGA